MAVPHLNGVHAPGVNSLDTGVLASPATQAVPSRAPGFFAAVARPSTALFCVKNGLSAFLMSLLARHRLHRKQVIVSSGSVPQLPRDEIYHAIEKECFTRVHPATNLRARLERIGFWADYLRGRTVYVYHTYSFDDQVKALSGRLFPPCKRVIVEHGTVELFRFISECQAKVRDPDRIFLLSFFEQTARYLEKHGIEPTLQAHAFPYPDEFVCRPSPEDEGRALFAVQPLVDSGTLSADDCHAVLKRFLGRRPRKTYVIKPHPRACIQTLGVVTRTLDEYGCPYRVLPEESGVLEKVFPALGCGEVCSFYSTACMLAARLYRVPWDTAVPEILRYTTVRKQIQLDLIRMIAELFEIDINQPRA